MTEALNLQSSIERYHNRMTLREASIIQSKEKHVKQENDFRKKERNLEVREVKNVKQEQEFEVRKMKHVKQEQELAVRVEYCVMQEQELEVRMEKHVKQEQELKVRVK